MAQVLKRASHGIWVSLDEKTVLGTDKVRRLTRKKQTKESRLDNAFEMLERDIQNFGYKSIKISTLLKHFSLRKRSAKNVETINDYLRSKGLYTLPQYSNELPFGSTLRLFSYPVRQLGQLFPNEKGLEDFVATHEHYKKLKIHSVVRQHRPRGSKDKLDFKGECGYKEIAVLELKNGGGGKTAVEQVLRYAALLKQEYPDCAIRTILVTGVQNYETALAIKGMLPAQRDLFEWYLYKYQKTPESFEFERVEPTAPEPLDHCESKCPVHCSM